MLNTKKNSFFSSRIELLNFFEHKLPASKILFTKESLDFIARLPKEKQIQLKDKLIKFKIINKSKKVRSRTKSFRALGLDEPPFEIQIDNKMYKRKEVFKHDSWAATALYEGENQKVVCKFNRIQPLFGIPMHWLGRRLANKENKLLKLLAKEPNIPKHCGEVMVNRQTLTNASAHFYVEGTPLKIHKFKLKDNFFDQLKKIINKIHEHKIAYVDLNKQENIIVDSNGDPCLIDFQICFHLSKRWPGNSSIMNIILKLLQNGDHYHIKKHMYRLRPDLLNEKEVSQVKRRPLFIRISRLILNPFRFLRRRLLVLLGFRTKGGKVTSENFIEHGLRSSDDFSILDVNLANFVVTIKVDHSKSEILVLSIKPDR